MDLIQNKVDLLDQLITAPTVNDVVTNVNANAGKSRSVSSMLRLLFSEEQKEIGWKYLQRFLEPRTYIAIRDAIARGLIYVHDSENLLLPYCYSFQFSRTLWESTFYGRLPTKPVKRLDSYISLIGDCVSTFSREVAGAVGLGSVMIDAGNLAYRTGLSLNGEDDSYINNCWQELIHTVNHESRGDQSPFTNISVMPKQVLESIPIVDPEHIPHTLYVQDLYLKQFLKGDPSTNGLPFTFPITTVNLIDVDKEFIAPVLEYPDRVNWNISDDSKFAMCCRLQMDRKLLAQSSNSFASAPLELGSHRVVTLNPNHIALSVKNWNNPQESYFYGIQRTLDTIIVPLLRAHRALLQWEIEKDILPLFRQGWMSMSRLFSTIGLLGLVEAAETLGDPTIVERTLIFLNEYVDKLMADSKELFNIEQIPGEQARFNLAEADKKEFPAEDVPNLYANQFVPLHEEADFLKKMEVEGKYYDLLTGGGITHFRLDRLPDPDQTIDILQRAKKAGCKHFAISGTYSICPDRHVTYGKETECPTCGKPIVDWMERGIGYYSMISAWGKRSQTKDFPLRKPIQYNT